MLDSPLCPSLSPLLSLNAISLAPQHRPQTLSRSLYPAIVFSPSWSGRYALLQTLGESGDEDGADSMWSGTGHQVVREAYGSTGCVNAIDWEDGGQERLATGGDDTKICIWKPGLDCALSSDGSKSVFPKLGYGLSDVLDTGHRANIFSVRWAPSNENRLFSCAGDSTVRVYDLSAATNSKLSTATVTPSNPLHRPFSFHENKTACTHVFRCHTDRVKRVAVEDRPDLFLTCGEDGTVRQHDLRAPHTCRSARQRSDANCPPPLASYQGLSLYSLSLSKLRPHLFAVAGRSPYAFLHDRRMPNSTAFERDWGSPLPSSSASASNLTHCVRRLGVPSPTTPWNGDITNSIVSCKLSPSNPRQLIVSYSESGIYLFDIDGETYTRPQKPVKADGERLSGNLSDDELDAELEGRSRGSLAGVAVRTGSLSDDELDAEIEEEVQEEVSSSSHSAWDVPWASTPAVSVAASTLLERTAASLASVLADDFDEADEGDGSDGVAESGDEHDELMGNSGEDDSGQDLDSEMEEVLSDEESMHDDEEEEEDQGAFNPRTRQHHPDVPMVAPSRHFVGHANSQTVKDVNFVANGSMVVSGSDDGNFFLWETETAELKAIFKGDESVVNVVIPHPRLPIVAVSGIDSSVKLFGPTTDAAVAEKANLVSEKDVIVARNGRVESSARIGFTSSALLASLAARLRAQGFTFPGEDVGEEQEEAEGGTVPGGGRRRIRVRVGPNEVPQDCVVS